MRIRSTRAQRARRMLVLAVIGLAATASQVEATITPVPPMTAARYGATATSIVDASGNVLGVLVAGGDDAGNVTQATAEFYSVATGTWTAAGSMNTERIGALAVALPVSAARPQGGVLVEGGNDSTGGPLSSAEVYDRATNTWAGLGGGSIGDPRTGEALVRAGDNVYVVGGTDQQTGTTLTSIERFNDVARPTWTTLAPMAIARRNLAATQIFGNRILVTGGGDSKLTPTTSSEIYDPAADTWSTAAPMATARYGQTATAVSGGAQVLVAGGNSSSGSPRLQSSELYTVATNSWADAGTMAAGRSGAQAVAIDAGLVEVVGGTDPRAATTTAESWTSSDGWAGPTGPGTTEPLDVDRQEPAVAMLGQTTGVLVAGGYTGATTQTTRTAVALFPSRPPVPTPTPAPVPPVITPAPLPLVTTPVPTPAPTPTPGLVPVQGRTLIAAPFSGTVRIRIGSGPYVPLQAGQAIPVGAFIDATLGHVTLIGAIGKGTQTAVFWGGVFQVTQPANEHGQVDLRIVGKPVCPAPRAKASAIRLAPDATAARAAARAQPKKSKKPPPRIWGDGHGNFQTRGANSAATVRGTKWLVEERCTGTFTQVARGVVSVHDFVRNKTFLLPAPRTYLARPRAAK